MAFADSVVVYVPCYTLSGFSVEALSSSLSRLWNTALGGPVFNWTPRFSHYAKSQSPSGISRSTCISWPEKSPLTSDHSRLLTEFSLRRETRHPRQRYRKKERDVQCVDDRCRVSQDPSTLILLEIFLTNFFRLIFSLKNISCPCGRWY